jgi:hypothetical protein
LAGEGGSALFTSIQTSTLWIHNSIIWNPRSGSQSPEIEIVGHGSSATGSAHIASSIGGIDRSPFLAYGEDVVHLDPEFTDPLGSDGEMGTADDDLSLSLGSPAIDKGLDSALPADWLDLDGDGDVYEAIPVDIAGNIRVVDGGSGMAIVDMGAREYGSMPVALETENSDASPIAPSAGKAFSAFPNPFYSELQIRFTSGRPIGPLEVEAFDILGRLVHKHDVSFFPIVPLLPTAGWPSGPYVIRIRSGHTIESIVVIKIQ